jgi:hypothetical protein
MVDAKANLAPAAVLDFDGSERRLPALSRRATTGWHTMLLLMFG